MKSKNSAILATAIVLTLILSLGACFFFNRQAVSIEPLPESEVEMTVTEKDDGVIELWQDGQKLIDTHGQTLVLARAIYNSLEIGISAYNERDKPATLYVDDVSISDQPKE